MIPRPSCSMSGCRASPPRCADWASRSPPAHNLSFIKGGMAMMDYFGAFGTQNARLRSRVRHGLGDLGNPQGTDGHHRRQAARLPRARGRPARASDKVLAACEALLPHLLHVARSTADPRAWSRLATGCIAAACRSSRPRSSRTSTGPPSSRSSRSSGPTASRPSSTPRASGTGTWSRSPSCPTGASSTMSTRATSPRLTRSWARSSA